MLSPRDTAEAALPQRPWSTPERRRTWLGYHRSARSASEPALSSLPTQLHSIGSERSGSRSLGGSFRKVRLLFSELFGASKVQSYREEWEPSTPRILSLGDLADQVWDPNAEGGQSGALANASLIYPPEADADESVLPVVLGRRGSRQREIFSL